MVKVYEVSAFSCSLRISVKINKLPLSYFDRHQSGDTLSRVTNDVDTIAQTMNQSLGTLVSNITLFLGSIIMMFYTNWIMALTAILSSLLGFMGMFAVLAKSQKYFVAKQEELGNLNGHIEEVYSGLNVVKAYNGKKESDKKFDEYNQKVCEANRKSQFLSGIMQPIMNFIGNFGYVAVCIVGALLTMNNIISFGVIIAFITYVRLFTNPLSQIAQSMTSLQSTAAASERVFEFLDEKEMADQSKINKTLDKNNVKGKIEFDNVVFQYDNNDKPTIKNFTATAEPGQKIAIVGPTGAGKTTMMQSISGIVKKTSGDVMFLNESIMKANPKHIVEMGLTQVPEGRRIFTGMSVYENLMMGAFLRKDKDGIKRDYEKVCEQFPILKERMNQDASTLSGGEQQMLAMGRALMAKPKLLLLDEPSMGLAPILVKEIFNIIEEINKAGTTVLLVEQNAKMALSIAHRAYVLETGKVVMSGTGEELAKSSDVQKAYLGG